MTGRGSALARLIVIAGPTGTGKSDLGIALAERLDGEIINADSMQIYCGMDIGTAKLPIAERRGVPHHLLDILEVTERASVAAYQRDARAAIEQVLDRGRTPLLVGGSGLYIQSVVDDIAFPATDPAVRERLEAELAERGGEVLWQRLLASDPAAAGRIGPSNSRRLVRALEVIEVTGRPFTATFPTPGLPRYDAVLICADRATPELDQRLADRVHHMMAAGFLDEVRALIGRGLREGVTARRALGYRQLLDAIDAAVHAPTQTHGRAPTHTETLTEDPAVAQAVTDTITATRRFVRRQRSWFRRDPRLRWVDGADPDLPDRCVMLARSGSVG